MTTFILIVYLAAIAYVAARDLRRRLTFSDFVNASGSMGWGKVALSTLATVFGASATLGVASRAARFGAGAFWWLAAGAVGLALQGALISGRLRGLDALTLPDAAGMLAGNAGKKLISAIIAVSWLGILAAQFSAAGAMATLLIPGAGLKAMVFSTSVLVIAYTACGGQISVIRTDAIQFALLVAGLAAAFAFCLNGEVGFADCASRVAEAAGGESAFGVAELIMVCGAFFLGPDLLSRNFAAKSAKGARNAALVAAAALPVMSAAITLIGMSVACNLALESGANPLASLVTRMPGALGALLGIGLFSAVISSADTCLANVSAIVCTDIIGTRKAKAARIAVIAIGAASVALALVDGDIIKLLSGAYSVYSPGIVCPLMVAIMAHGKRRIRRDVWFAAVLAGGAFGAIGLFWNPEGVSPPLVGMAVSLAGALAAVRWGKPALDSAGATKGASECMAGPSASGATKGAASRKAGYVAVPREAMLRRIRAGEDVIGIVHWGLNTYTDREWGFGDEDPGMLAPDAFDADQIARAAAAGGLKGLVIVCKHHDGFCLWPTNTTGHNISKSPFREGKGDYVREMADACRRAGLRFGVYVSPWDRNNAKYAMPEYVETYHAQLKELLGGDYGEVFEVWFDGANGGDGYYGGDRAPRRIQDGYYRFDEVFKFVRELQPGATIFAGEHDGSDLRWPGNERGVLEPDSRASIDTVGGYADARYGNPEYGAMINTGKAGGAFFRMCEADFPLRPGWFYHASEKGKSKSAAYLMKLYLSSAGNGGIMNIGLSPDRRGAIDDEDARVLRQFGEMRKAMFASPVKSGSCNLVVMREDVAHGERVNGWALESDGKQLISGKSIGAKRIRILNEKVAAESLAIRVDASAGDAKLMPVEAYLVDDGLLALIQNATTESGETDTAQWMTRAKADHE